MRRRVGGRRGDEDEVEGRRKEGGTRTRRRVGGRRGGRGRGGVYEEGEGDEEGYKKKRTRMGIGSEIGGRGRDGG